MQTFLMKPVQKEQFHTLLNQFQGRKILLDIRTKEDCLFLSNYKQFNWWEEENDNVEYIKFRGENEDEYTEIPLKEIIDFTHLGAKSIFNEVLEITLKNKIVISLCNLDIPIFCMRCEQVLNDELTIFTIKGNGNYGSKFDEQKVNLKICDNCLHTIITERKGI